MKNSISITLVLLLTLSAYVKSQTDFDPKAYGQEILDGKAKLKSKKTMQIVDSLFCKNEADKDFYFNVVVKIQELIDENSKGHLANLCSKYYLENTLEFLTRSKKMKKIEVNKFLDFIAYDIYIFNAKEKDMKVIKGKLKTVYDKHADFPKAEKGMLKKYNAYLLQKATGLIKSNQH